MKSALIACNTIRDELEKAMAETGVARSVVWIESGLHLVPDSLRRRIQEELEKISITVETLQLWAEKMLVNGIIDPDAYRARKQK